ncbi:hypothetical protein MJO28_015818 [Puccinia striiformis f. sp. tritici]|uniref:Uncharacterized protein n=1 Tax=Puccinia striiformis f. sp. tritici TaxID=168172 RepID=A0ACC0DSM3_9BASI|nr:hypothetical protein MJO28_015818 [Puccinia striiformis f. sp. tritici]
MALTYNVDDFEQDLMNPPVVPHLEFVPEDAHRLVPYFFFTHEEKYFAKCYQPIIKSNVDQSKLEIHLISDIPYDDDRLGWMMMSGFFQRLRGASDNNEVLPTTTRCFRRRQGASDDKVLQMTTTTRCFQRRQGASGVHEVSIVTMLSPFRRQRIHSDNESAQINSEQLNKLLQPHMDQDIPQKLVDMEKDKPLRMHNSFMRLEDSLTTLSHQVLSLLDV